MNLSKALNTAKSVITANSPALLVGTAVVGVVATGVLAAKGGYKARGIIDAAEEEKGVPLSTQEKFTLTWLCYAVPAVTGASTIASVVGVHTIHNKRHAALAGLYAVTSDKLDDYREKAEEMLGAKKAQDLNNSTSQAAVDKDPINDHEILMLDEGSEICYDQLSGRYFKGSKNIIDRAFLTLNEQLLDDGDATLNDFYDHVGLPHNDMGAMMGWSGARVEPRWGTVSTSDGRPAIAFYFRPEPKMPIKH